jgi:transcriptional regulator with XRE-family HTH domain
MELVMTTQLRILRLKYHITLDELAAVSGIQNQRLSEYERGERSALPVTRDRIGACFLHLAEERRNSYQSLCDELSGDSSELLTALEVEKDES